MNWEQEAREVRKLASRIELLRASLSKEKEQHAAAVQRLDNSIAAQDILQHLAQAVQQKAHQRIGEIVSSCLSAVFDDPYQFKIQFERKRGRTEAKLLFLRGDLEVDPLTASGGGMVDVAAFALRAACLMLHQPRLRRLLVLDEPFKFVSEHYRPRIRQMMERLSEELGLQIVMVTHEKAYEIGNVVQL